MSTRSDPRELERQRILYNSLATGGGRIDKSDHSYRSSTMHKRLSGHVEQEVQGLDDPTLRTHTTACEEACSGQRRVHGIPERESWVSSGQERDWSIDKSYLRNVTRASIGRTSSQAVAAIPLVEEAGSSSSISLAAALRGPSPAAVGGRHH